MTLFSLAFLALLAALLVKRGLFTDYRELPKGWRVSSSYNEGESTSYTGPAGQTQEHKPKAPFFYPIHWVIFGFLVFAFVFVTPAISSLIVTQWHQVLLPFQH